MGVRKNYRTGMNFEAVFNKLAQLNGFVVIKNWHTCRFLPMGKVKVVHGQLDFTLLADDGRVGFFDCKSFATRFAYSEINEEQLTRSVLYNRMNVPAGFIVHFRDQNIVSLITGEAIQRKGPRTSIGPEDGITLGTGYNFDVRKIMERIS